MLILREGEAQLGGARAAGGRAALAGSGWGASQCRHTSASPVRREQCQHSWLSVSARIIAHTLAPIHTSTARARHATDQTPNDDPQPQVRLTLGFWRLKPDDMSSSLKSRTVPFR